MNLCLLTPLNGFSSLLVDGRRFSEKAAGDTDDWQNLINAAVKSWQQSGDCRQESRTGETGWHRYSSVSTLTALTNKSLRFLNSSIWSSEFPTSWRSALDEACRTPWPLGKAAEGCQREQPLSIQSIGEFRVNLIHPWSPLHPSICPS